MPVLKVTCPLITGKTAGFSYKQRNVPNVTGVTRCYKVLQGVTNCYNVGNVTIVTKY